MKYTWSQLEEMKKDEIERIADLERMIEMGSIGGYRNLDEVKQALKFEKSELAKIENEMKSRTGIGI
jgi:hypothetical protein